MEEWSVFNCVEQRRGVDVRLQWRSLANDSALALDLVVANRGKQVVRLRNLYPIITSQEHGDGFRFWTKEQSVKVLTDEWERCYGSAGVFPLDSSRSHRSAWDIHIFDLERQRTLSASFYEIPKTKLSYSILRRPDSNQSDFVVRGDTHSGEKGLLLSPQEQFSMGEHLVRVSAGSSFDALEQCARIVAERNNVAPPQLLPIGWVDWYFAKAKTTEKDILENLDFMARELKDYNLKYVQLDSGWQLGVETSPPPHNVIAGGPWVPNSKFPRGTKWYADRIRERGFKPGIWVRPFHIIDGAKERTEHPDWFNEKGQMDFSHPEVLNYIRQLFRTLTNEWGYEYIKFDFPSYDLFGEWGPKLFEDHAAQTEPHSQSITNIQAYRRAMELIKETVGEKAELLACNSVMAPTLGIANVFRIGDDVGDWARTFQYGVKSIAARYYTNGAYWTNDPDVMLVHEPFTIEQARMWTSLIALSGGVVFLSENFSQLPKERLEIVKKAMPVYRNHHQAYQFGRPADLLENNPPQIWNLRVEREFEEWNVVGLFNWSNQEIEKDVKLSVLGLAPSEAYHLFEFWENEYRGFVRDGFKVTLPPESCKVFSVRKALDHPQLLSTQRHLTQGGVELREVRWDSYARELKGIAQTIRNNPYELAIHVPPGHRVDRMEGLETGPSRKPDVLILYTPSDETSDVSWSIRFA